MLKTFLTVCTLSELDKDDPVGEGGGQESSDKASVHCEEPASWDVRPAPHFSYQNLVEPALKGGRYMNFLAVKKSSIGDLIPWFDICIGTFGET